MNQEQLQLLVERLDPTQPKEVSLKTKTAWENKILLHMPGQIKFGFVMC